MTPTTQAAAADGTKELRVSKSVFDLDSRGEVDVVKIGTFAPVANMHEFTSRLGNDSAKILAVVNDGLEAYEREQLAANDSIGWSVEDEEGKLSPFSGTLLTEEKSKQLSANVLNMAKMLFGYAKDMVGGREAKREAKAKAAEMLLSNPAVVEALKK